jgi:hypothetical protein
VDASPTTPAPASAPAPAKNSAGLVIGLVVVVLVVVGCVIAGLVNHGSGGGSSEAIAQCEAWVGQDLVSPGSAKFTGETTAADGAVWTVTGLVDSQNLLGGLVRNEWTCVVRDDGETWKLLSLTGLDN